MEDFGRVLVLAKCFARLCENKDVAFLKIQVAILSFKSRFLRLSRGIQPGIGCLLRHFEG